MAFLVFSRFLCSFEIVDQSLTLGSILTNLAFLTFRSNLRTKGPAKARKPPVFAIVEYNMNKHKSYCNSLALLVKIIKTSFGLPDEKICRKYSWDLALIYLRRTRYGKKFSNGFFQLLP